MATDRSRTRYPAILVPDPDINSTTLATDSSYTALYPRPGQPVPTGTTAMALAAHGTQSSGTLDVKTQQGGIVGPQGASFLWKDSGATDWYGWDAPTVITGWRSLVWATTPAIAQPVALPLQSGRLLVHYAYGTGADQVYQSGRNSDGTLITPALVDLDAVGASYVSPGTLQLPSGKILLFAWIQDTAADTATMRMMHSDDDGDTWTLGSSGCLPATVSTAASTGYVIMRTRVAYANGQILCIVWLRNNDTTENFREELRQYASSDGGHTFSLIWESDRSLTGASQDGGGFPDIAVVDGAFIVSYVSLIDNDPVVARLESAYESLGGASLNGDVTTSEAWATQSGVSPGYYFTAGDLWLCTDETGALYLSGRQPTVGNQWIVLQSTDGGDTWAAMARSSLVGGAGKWWDAADSGTYPADACGRWLRGRILVATCHQSNPATYDGGSLSLLSLGGYSTATMPGYDAWRVDNRQVTWGQTYLPLDEPQDCGWTKTTTGAPTDAITSGLLVLAAGVAETILYSVVPGGTVAGGLGASWALDTTSGSARVRLRVADITEGYSMTLTLSTTTLTAVDEISGGTIASAAATGEVHVLAWITNGKASVWYRAAVTDALEPQRAWTRLVDDEPLQDDAGATITASSLQWGHAVNGGSIWRHMAWIDDGSAAYAGTGLGSAVTPDGLLGRRFSLEPSYLDTDTALSATGGPTYPGDQWAIATAYENGVDRLDPAVSPSERDGALLDPTVTHELIWDLHTTNTLLWGRPMAIALLSTNIQTATLYGYDGAVWVNLGSLSAVVTASASYTRTGRGVRVNSGGTQRVVERNALAGATIGLGGGKFRKILGNTEGQIGASTSTQAILQLEDVDDTEGTSGTCTIWMPRIICYAAQHSEYRRLKLSIPVTTTPDSILRLGKVLIGSLVLLPVQPSDGREISHQPQRITSRPVGGVRAYRNLGPTRRVVTLPLSDLMPSSQIYATSPAPGYARLSSHASAVPTANFHGQALSMVGLINELAGSYVVYLPMVLQSSQLTTMENCPIPQHAVYGSVAEPVTLRTDYGSEGVNPSLTVSGLVIEEEP